MGFLYDIFANQYSSSRSGQKASGSLVGGIPSPSGSSPGYTPTPGDAIYSNGIIPQQFGLPPALSTAFNSLVGGTGRKARPGRSLIGGN